jgi:hypothetical protein
VAKWVPGTQPGFESEKGFSQAAARPLQIPGSVAAAIRPKIGKRLVLRGVMGEGIDKVHAMGNAPTERVHWAFETPVLDLGFRRHFDHHTELPRGRKEKGFRLCLG